MSKLINNKKTTEKLNTCELVQMLHSSEDLGETFREKTQDKVDSIIDHNNKNILSSVNLSTSENINKKDNG